MKRIRKKSNYFMVLFLSVIMCFSLIQPIELKASEPDTEIIQEEWIEILEEEEETLGETIWEEENDISLEIENTDLEEEEVDSLEEIIDPENQESQIETQENVLEDASYSVEVWQEKIDTLPSIDEIKEMSDEEKDALMEELADMLDQLDALLENGTIDMEQYEVMVLKIMALNDEMIGDTAALMGTVTTIDSIDKLIEFRNDVNNGANYVGQTVTLTSNLDLSSVGNWTPIGNSSNPFKGTFDGGNHIIYNLSINTSERYCGLFGRLNNATIRNLGLENVGVISSHTDVAGLAGNAQGGRIECCYVTGYVQGIGGVSGILGSTHSSSYPTTIQNCYARVKLTQTSGGTTYDIAGISGWNEATSVKIDNCYSACIGEKRPIAGWSDGNAVYNNQFVSTYFDSTLSPDFITSSGRADLL